MAPVDRANRIIEQLEQVTLRKAMYFQPVTPEVADTFLGGFLIGCMACGLVYSWIFFHQAAQTRGWKSASLGPIPDMRRRGLSDEEIIDELIAIHIDAVRLANQDKAPMLPLQCLPRRGDIL